MADGFGKQLLADVEVIGFDELLTSLRLDHDTPTEWFNCAQIDGILQKITAKSASPPALEITSLGAGGGKTHLLYLLTSLAVLPSQHGGNDGCVVIVDTDNSFSIDRLAQQIRCRLMSWNPDLDTASVEAIVGAALYHVYIYKPQSMRDLVTNLKDLPEYFLHSTHYSLDRCMSFIAIDSASAFYWQTRAEEENAAFTTSMQSSTTTSEPSVTFADLRSALEVARKALQCAMIMTSRHIGRIPKTMVGELPRTLRTSLPSPLGQLPTLRFIVRRMPVKRLLRGLSVAEMARENSNRMKAVSLSRFECFVNESGLNIQDIQLLRATEDGFYFRIKPEGVIVETPGGAEAERE